MSGENWMEETVPSRRVESDRDRGGSAVTPIGLWALGVVVALLILALCSLWALYFLRGRGIIDRGPTPTPIVWTSTPAPSPTPSPTATAEPTPTTSPDIDIGRYVQVTGTGGYGLSLREGPGENYTRMDVALDGEVFVVVDGPTVIAGAEWWQMRDPDNEEREWWAVGNFLEPVDRQ